LTDIYSLNELDSIEAEAIRGSMAQKGIYVTPNLIRRFNGDGNTAIIFKRLLYCCEQWADEEGWFFQTAETIERVVGLGYTALQRSIKRLESMGLIEKKLGGMPYKTHYRVNLSAYLELIRQNSSSGTSAKTSIDTSAKTSSGTSDETCSGTSGKQVILSDPSNDTENDTYSADAEAEPTDSDMPIPDEDEPGRGYTPGPGRVVQCEDPDTGETVGEPDWRYPQTQFQHQALQSACKRGRFYSKAEYTELERIRTMLEAGEMTENFWAHCKWCAENYRWKLPMLLKYALDGDKMREWEARQ